MLELHPTRRRPRRHRRVVYGVVAVLAAQSIGAAVLVAHCPLGVAAMTGLGLGHLLGLLYVTGRREHHLHAALDRARERERDLRAELAVANTDMVTGLATRRRIYQHIADTPTTRMLTVVFADVDGLKTVNDTFGHQIGDEFLAAIAARMDAMTVAGDVLVRLGGDEFALATARPPDQIATLLTRVLRAPAAIGGQLRPLTVSAGIVHLAGGDPHHVLGRAEAAMRNAKRSGGGVEHYNAARDGTPPPPGVRPVLRPRDRHP